MKRNMIVMVAVLLLSACSSVNTKQNHRLDSLEEKVDALLVYNNKTYDILVDNELRISELEKDAKKRGVPVPQKFVSVENLPQHAMQPNTQQKDGQKSQLQTSEQVVSAVQNMQKQENLPEQLAKDVADTQIGAITGQDLTKAEEISQKDVKSNVTEAPKQRTENLQAQSIQNEQALASKQVDKPVLQKSEQEKQQVQQTEKIAEKQFVQQQSEIQKKDQSAISSRSLQTDQSQKEQTVTQKVTSKDMYNKAYNLYRQKQYANSEKAFDDFLAQYPQDVLAPNALYWKGENLYARALYAQAIFAFKEVQTRYPKHPKTADSLLKTAMCYARLGDTENASLHFLVLMEDWPQSEAAAKARTMGAK